MATTQFNNLMSRWQSWQARHMQWRPYWQQLGDVLLPNRADFTRVQMPGSSREVGIYDGTPRLALRDLSSTLDGLIKPQTSNWFEPDCDDEAVAAADDTKLWFEVVRERMWKAIYAKGARFVQRSGETDNALACFGWGTLWMQLNRAKDGLLFRSFPNNNVCFDENEDGLLDAMAVEEVMRPRQAAALYDRLKKPLPDQIAEALKPGKPDTTFSMVQVVIARDDRDGMTIPAPNNFGYVSALLDVRNEQVLETMGFAEFPAAIPRWDTAPGDIYPRSPGMMALPDSRTLQAMGKTLLMGGQRAVDPPVWIQNDSILSPLRTFPGGITVIDVSDTQGASPIGTFPVSENIPLGREMQQDYRAQVEAAFFKNVFNLPMNAPNMTATEILERKDQFIRTVGPVFGRLETDYIGHIIERVFGIMERAGAFPPRPDILMGVKVTFRFQSPIQQARKQLEIAGLSRALELLAPLATVQPEIYDNFDGDAIARDSPAWSGMTPKWLRPMDKVVQLRTDKANAANDQTALAAMPGIGNTVKNVAQAQAIGQQPTSQLPVAA